MSLKKNSFYFIQQYSKNSFFHGGIGLVDVEKILTDLNFKPIQFPHEYGFSIREKILRFSFMIRVFLTLPSRSVVIAPFQLHSFFLRFLVYRLIAFRKIRMICLICDIDGLRDGDKQILQKEISMLRKYKYFIVHNTQMQKWLNMHVKDNRSVILNLFDFLASPELKKRSLSYTVVFAGNLSKSRFINKLDQLFESSPNLKFFIYGNKDGVISDSAENVSYKGVFEPYSLPSLTQGSFGLVWDGDSIEQCTGSYGSYLQLNSPHKLSFYILCGLPVIVWDKAATASFVTGNRIGITISSLFEMENKINAISETDYQNMRSNMHALANKISAGEYLKNAVKEIIEIIRKEEKQQD